MLKCYCPCSSLFCVRNSNTPAENCEMGTPGTTTRKIKLPSVIRDAFSYIFGNSETQKVNDINSGKISDEGKIIRQQPKSQQNEFITLNNMQLSNTMSLSNNKNSEKNQQFFISECSINSISTHKDFDSECFTEEGERTRSINSAQIAIWEPTAYEKELVKRTWSDDFDFLYELGAAIYIYIFDHNPHTKKLFPSIHQHGENYRESREFRSQALKFVQTISHSVKHLYHMDRLAPHLYRIGERHVKFAQRGFKPEYWNGFLDAMEVSITNHIKSIKDLTEDQRKDATQVWRRLAFYIITHMKIGYFDRLRAVENDTAKLC